VVIETTVEERLFAHLRASLGAWPPPPDGLLVTTSPLRTTPGWDGVVRPFAGIRTPHGAVLSVTPSLLDAARALGATLEEATPGLERLLGGRLFDVMHRWTDDPAPIEPLGEWVPWDDPVVPPWLHPFGGDVLVHVEDGRYVGGVGLKRHDEHAWELSVGTEEAARGRGIARRLVVTAARRVLDEGRVPTYLHDLRNEASARVAEASGFPDRGWRLVVTGP
jgi:RimJ/RimL family protein N-acetyltransferase